jgi:hypothetical protein
MSHTFLLVMLSPEVLCAHYRTEDACPASKVRMKKGNELSSTSTPVCVVVSIETRKMFAQVRTMLLLREMLSRLFVKARLVRTCKHD